MLWRAFTGAALWGLVSILQAFGVLTFTVLLACVVVGSATQALFGEADDAALRSVVDADDYPSAQSVNQGREATIALLGGPLGGFLYTVSPWAPFAVSSAALIVLASSASNIRTDLSPHNSAAPRAPSNSGFLRSIASDVAAGFTTIWSDQPKRAIALAALVLNFGFTLAIVAVQLHLIGQGKNPVLISALASVLAGTTLVGAFMGSYASHRVTTGHLAIGSLAVMIAAVTGMAVVHTYPMLICWYALLGIATPVVNASMIGYFFASIPIELQGRTGSTLGVMTMGLAAGAPIVSGMAVRAGHVTLILWAASGILVSAFAVLAGNEHVRAIGSPEQWATNAR